MTPFLRAEWRNLLMLNFEVAPELLCPLVPRGTELDTFEGRAYVSLVGFQFLRTAVCGVRVPFCTNFEEVNLRFYVRRFESGAAPTAPAEMRRGVVFIKEIVPRAAIAFVARVLYGEPYVCLPMAHSIRSASDSGGEVCEELAYRFRLAGRWCELAATRRGAGAICQAGSVEEFITEHYWGYTARTAERTSEYRVEHPKWHVWQTPSAGFSGEAASLYGADFASVLKGKPSSALVAEGSKIEVYPGRYLPLSGY